MKKRNEQATYNAALSTAQAATTERRALEAAVKNTTRELMQANRAADTCKTVKAITRNAEKAANLETLLIVLKRKAQAAAIAEGKAWQAAREAKQTLDALESDERIRAAIAAVENAQRRAATIRDKQSATYHAAQAAHIQANDALAQAIQAAAQKAAYCAMRTAHVGNVKTRTIDGNEVTDGTTTGGNKRTAQLRNSQYYGLNAQDTTYDDNTTGRTATDADDATQAAALAIWEVIAELGSDESVSFFRAAMAAVHALIRSEKSATTTRARKTYDTDGQLIAATEYRYERYTHIAYHDLENERLIIGDERDALLQRIAEIETNEIISGFMELLKAHASSPSSFERDVRIIAWTAQGVKQDIIAQRLDVSQQAISQRLAGLRSMAREWGKFNDLNDIGIIHFSRKAENADYREYKTRYFDAISRRAAAYTPAVQWVEIKPETLAAMGDKGE